MKKIRIILFGLLVLGLGIAIWKITIQEPRSGIVEKDLVNEFNKIDHPSNVKLLSLSSSHKANQAIVVAKYDSTLAYNEILEHYKEKLSKLGWKYDSEQKVTDWGEDLGGQLARFTKNNYTLRLQYAGDQANYGWNYALSLSWGLT